MRSLLHAIVLTPYSVYINFEACEKICACDAQENHNYAENYITKLLLQVYNYTLESIYRAVGARS